MTTQFDAREVALEVLRRLAPKLGADGRKGTLISVFTGATVGLADGLREMGKLALAGYGIKLCFTDSSKGLYGSLVEKELGWISTLTPLNGNEWWTSLEASRAVLVPTLSMNSLSLLSSLEAPTMASNILMHALFMAKPLIMARDGAHPDSPGRASLGLNRGPQALHAAVLKRFETITGFGGHFCWASELCRNVLSRIEESCGPEPAIDEQTAFWPTGDKILTARHVARAVTSGARVILAQKDAIVTPLAREEALRKGINIQRA